MHRQVYDVTLLQHIIRTRWRQKHRSRRHCHRIVLTVQEATSPVFTLDGQYLLYVDRGCTVIAYSLSDLAPRYHVPDCPAHQLIAVPQHHRLFLATRFDADETSQKTAVVSVADLNSRYIRF